MKIWPKIEGFFKTVDMISRKPQLRINDRKRFSTSLGGVLSILIYIGIGLSFGYFGQEMYMKRFPQISRSDEFISSENENVTVNNTTEWVIFFLRDKDGNYLDYMTNGEVNVKSLSSFQNKNGMKKTIVVNTLMNCQESPIITYLANSQSNKQFNGILHKGYCVIGDFNINNWVDEMGQQRTKLNLQVDINLDEGLEVISLELFYTKYSFDDNDYTLDGKNYFQRYETTLDPMIVKKMSLNLVRLNVNTDEGLIFTDYRSDNFIQVESLVESVNTIRTNQHTVSFDLEFGLSIIKSVYYRKYLKIQSLLAEVGGITKAFLILAFFVNVIHNNTRFYEKLINELFDVKDLRKNYQFYENKTKHYFRKYRNSIALKRVKDFEFIKRDQSNVSMPIRVNNFTKPDLSNTKKKFATTRIGNDLLIKEGLINANEGIIEEVAENGIHAVNSSVNNMIDHEESQGDFYNIVQSNNTPILNPLQMNQGASTFNHNDQVSKGRKDNLSTFFSQETLKNNKAFKENFNKVKTDQFTLKLWDIFRLKLCCKSDSTLVRNNILQSGRLLVNQRLDVVSLLKKLLDFDRFKNLVLKDYQLVLLNSLSKFLLDPETVNLVEFKNITFDKLIDSIVKSKNSNSVIDFNLREFVKLKYEFDQE